MIVEYYVYSLIFLFLFLLNPLFPQHLILLWNTISDSVDKRGGKLIGRYDDGNAGFTIKIIYKIFLFEDSINKNHKLKYKLYIFFSFLK